MYSLKPLVIPRRRLFYLIERCYNNSGGHYLVAGCEKLREGDMTASVKGVRFYSFTTHLTDVEILLTGPTGGTETLTVSTEIYYNQVTIKISLNDYSTEDVRRAANRILLDPDAASTMVKRALLEYAKKKIGEDFVSK